VRSLAVVARACEAPPEADLRANFVVVNINGKRKVPLQHEELTSGAKAGKARAGAGYVLDALKGLHRP